MQNGFLDRDDDHRRLDRSLSAVDTLSLLATSTRTSYEPSAGGTAFTDTARPCLLAPCVELRRPASACHRKVSCLNYDNALNTSIQIYRNQVGIDSSLSALLSFRGNAGAAYLVTEGGATTSVLGGIPTGTSTSSTTLDWIGDAVLTYRMLKSTTLSVTASQSVGPSIVGSLFKRDSIAASITQLINSQSSLDLLRKRQQTDFDVDDRLRFGFSELQLQPDTRLAGPVHVSLPSSLREFGHRGVRSDHRHSDRLRHGSCRLAQHHGRRDPQLHIVARWKLTGAYLIAAWMLSFSGVPSGSREAANLSCSAALSGIPAPA